MSSVIATVPSTRSVPVRGTAGFGRRAGGPFLDPRREYHRPVSVRSRRHREIEADVLGAIVAGASAFVVAALVGSAARSHVPSVLLGLLLLAGVLVVTRYGGVLYGLPVGVVSVLAFDWYFLPPLRDLDAATVLVLALFLLASVIVGAMATDTNRRAAASEAARGRLADEQAALRRVATLIARQAPAHEVFANVTDEVRRLLGVDVATMIRFEGDGTATVVGASSRSARSAPEASDPALTVGGRLTMEGENIPSLVQRTGRPVRIDDYTEASGPIAGFGKSLGIRAAVGCPIVVDGRLWGSMAAGSRQAERLPPGTDARIEEFTELVATGIANIEARTDLAAAGARIIAAADEERRRVVRDLHDGAQQRLVHTVVTLKLARRALDDDTGEADTLVTEALEHAESATAELRQLAHGILPSVLTSGGLRAGVGALASRMPVPVKIGVSVDRLPPAIEATAYFVVAEALTNVVKHAHAHRAEVTARVVDGTLTLSVRDDGVGGARLDGSGLVGLRDRVAVFDGSLRVERPPDGGTLVAVVIPLGG
jgi:signal transduction histidine kinase